MKRKFISKAIIVFLTLTMLFSFLAVTVVSAAKTPTQNGFINIAMTKPQITFVQNIALIEQSMTEEEEERFFAESERTLREIEALERMQREADTK